MGKKNKKVVPVKRKVKYKNIFKVIFVICLIILGVYYVINVRIKNIYVKGNTFLSDQYIIDVAKLKDYPTIISTKNSNIKKILEDDVYIKKAKVYKTGLMDEINIEITENKPVAYYVYEEKYLLEDSSRVSDKYNVPVVINQVPDNILKELTEKLGKISPDTLNRISEIRYYPNKVDEELFFLTMNDGNYIYINFNSFSKLDSYMDIVISFNNKKGIIHLDSGNYLEIIK